MPGTPGAVSKIVTTAKKATPFCTKKRRSRITLPPFLIARGLNDFVPVAKQKAWSQQILSTLLVFPVSKTNFVIQAAGNINWFYLLRQGTNVHATVFPGLSVLVWMLRLLPDTFCWPRERCRLSPSFRTDLSLEGTSLIGARTLLYCETAKASWMYAEVQSRSACDRKRVMLDARLQCHPLTEARWDDFERLFGRNGACGGCWCMLWRLPRKQFEAQKGDGNRNAMRALVAAGETPGLLGYLDDRTVGWCAVAPREDYPALSRSRVLKPVDDQPCWSVSCLFVHRKHRKQGVATQLLKAAVDYVRGKGGVILEGYPVEPKGDSPIPPAFAWTGVPKAFQAAGFSEVARRSPTRPVMRIGCKPPGG